MSHRARTYFWRMAGRFFNDRLLLWSDCPQCPSRELRAGFYALFVTLGRVNLVPKVKARSTAYRDACIGNFGTLMVYEASEIAIFRCLPVAF
jgi:hypothetical protein